MNFGKVSNFLSVSPTSKIHESSISKKKKHVHDVNDHHDCRAKFVDLFETCSSLLFKFHLDLQPEA